MKAAGYCRVSTDQRDQIHSFESQKQYFYEYITNRNDLELTQIYADEGITGTSTKNRIAFLRMMEDAREGKFQLLLTKEVSRFSRNILDTIGYTRKLKAYGVGVLFMTDGIDTRDPDAELRLSIMASIAQEESRKTSCRVKWGQLRQMERGIVFGHALLGYEVNHGILHIEPYGAEIVRKIFQKYVIEQKSAAAIARELEEYGTKNASGIAKWNPSHIIRILRNEKYVGDLIQKKSYTPDYLTHKKNNNDGMEPYVILSDHHLPIIERELWNQAQLELNRRSHKKEQKGSGSHFPLSGKIRCGVCGCLFHSRLRQRKDGTSYRKWSCKNANGCKIGVQIRDDLANELIRCALRQISHDEIWLHNVIASIIAEIDSYPDKSDHTANRIQTNITKIDSKLSRLPDLYLSGVISYEEWMVLKREYDSKIQILKNQLLHLTQIDSASNEKRIDLKGMISDMFQNASKYESFSREILENISVFPNRSATLRLKELNQEFLFDFSKKNMEFIAIQPLL